MIKGAIFDIDGTILDSSPAWVEAPRRYLDQYGYQISDEQLLYMNPMTFEEGILYLKEYYSLKDAPETIAQDLMNVISTMYLYEVKEKKWCRPYLDYFFKNQIPVVLATAGNPNMAYLALRRLKLSNTITACLSCDNLQTSKREPRIFLESANYIKADPSEIWVFEDSLTALKTAKEAGFITVGISDYANSHCWDQVCNIADYTINGDLETKELLNLL